MSSIFRGLMLCLMVTLAAGCARGVRYHEMASSFPPLKETDGRIFFYRTSSALGVVAQPSIRLNGEAVGRSRPRGYFFVDRPAGMYKATAKMEMENSVSFYLAPGEEKYILSTPTLGFVMGNISLTLEDPVRAKRAMRKLSYTGDMTSSLEDE
jgi:hypothetical protein